MASIIRYLRYVVFALLVICNGIAASAAIWNLFLGQSVNLNVKIDAYIAAVSILALAFTFVVIFLQLASKNSLCGRVWFECAWMASFMVLELVGAITASAILPPALCSNKARLSLVDSCLSTSLVLSFLWIPTLTLLGYLSLLSISALLQSKKDAQIWHCPVNHFPWTIGSNKRSLPSAPTSPAMEQTHMQPAATTVFAAPAPRHAHPSALYSYRGGLDSQYEIEYFEPPAAVPNEAQVQLNKQTEDKTQTTLALYPEYMQPALLAQPRSSLQRNGESEPSPLGNWPHESSQRTRNLSQPEMPARTHSRPAGPRKRSHSGVLNPPPPLDLSKITSFKPHNSANV